MLDDYEHGRLGVVMQTLTDPMLDYLRIALFEQKSCINYEEATLLPDPPKKK